MILVADSGSSKTDWITSFADNKKFEFSTSGMNPFFLTEKDIIKILQNTPAVKKIAKDILEIHFFGSGCSSPDRREVISNALSQVFKRAFISVDSDLTGSAYATCGNNKGLSCILGTGSNISFYNGSEVVDGKHGLGYILGDEASGTYFGKKLITTYLYGLMPADLHKQFARSYDISKEILIHHVYQQASPNFYLASFAKFMSEHREHPFITDLLRQGFTEFITTAIHSYPDYGNYNCHFVGSIAHAFEGLLRDTCSQHGVKAGKILKHPIDELFDFIVQRESSNAAHLLL